MTTTDEVRAKVKEIRGYSRHTGGKPVSDEDVIMCFVDLFGMAVECLGEIAFALHEINVRGGGQ